MDKTTLLMLAAEATDKDFTSTLIVLKALSKHVDITENAKAGRWIQEHSKELWKAGYYK